MPYYVEPLDPDDYFDPRHPEYHAFWNHIRPFLDKRFLGTPYFANSDPAENAATDPE